MLRGETPAADRGSEPKKRSPGPFGAKAVGEAGISLIAPAIANAIADATGIRIKEMLITAGKIFYARQ